MWLIQNGVRLSPSPLIDISAEVGNWRDHSTRFHADPNFLTNGEYLMYAVDRHGLMNSRNRELQRRYERVLRRHDHADHARCTRQSGPTSD